MPGPAGAPDVPLLICRPSGASAPTPAIHHTHGGGMVLGDNRMGLPEMLDLAADIGAAVVSVEYRLAPRPPTPAPSRTATPGWSGPPRTPPNSASTRRAWHYLDRST
ncbi:alpha/beta hydrolase [Actinomadura sediminis]|uniref:Alpha/beta hydrolase n=1 Tax=Actinomadura sediminis TaxID=1038904 RepID=A0ABW3ESY8_9ACTN